MSDASTTSDTERGTREAKRYAIGRLRLWAINQALTLAFLASVQGSGLARWWADRVAMVAGSHPWLEVVGMALGLGALYAVLQAPLVWYGGWVLERRFHLSTQTWRDWTAEQVKAAALGGLFGLIAVETLYVCLRLDPGPRGWLWVGLAWCLYSVVFTRLFPVVILPLFFKVAPLDDAALTERLRALAERCRLGAVGIFTINLGSKTKKANAALTGIGRSRRILLGDTLLAHYPPEEVEVVLAHEIGHHRLRHIWAMLLIGGALGLVGFQLVGLAASRLVGPLGLGGVADVAGLPMVWGLWMLYDLALMPIEHAISRRFERDADRFALETTRQPSAFIACMRRLAEQNLADPEPSPWVEWWFYDHPAIARRIRFAEAFKTRTGARQHPLGVAG